MTKPQDSGLGQDQQLYEVMVGDLVKEVAGSGSLIYPNRDSLTFGIQGTVGEVLVGEGDSIVAGPP